MKLTDRQKKSEILVHRLANGVLLFLMLVWQFSPVLVYANPTDPTVVAGSASVTSSGSTMTITQNSSRAIINWSDFSNAAGELTKFLQPDSSSAILNRVTGGNISSIYGTIEANGHVYLLNPNGVVIGPTGVINAGSFMASTLDIDNNEFMAGGNMHLIGASTASIINRGAINATIGDVYLIAEQVINEGLINAPNGTVGLAGGHSVLLQQAGDEHLFIDAGSNGSVTNIGTIQAAQAEIKAAGGNAYALAINNEGTIRATGVSNVGGKILLVAKSGTTRNTGTLSAKTSTGSGGFIETSGDEVDITGTIDFGTGGGEWYIDPTNFTLSNGNVGTYITTLNGNNAVTLDATNNITVSTAVTWTSAATLTLTAGNDIYINGAINAASGSLTLWADNSAQSITTGANGSISVYNFTLARGRWYQVGTTLPNFAVGNNFTIASGAQFLRAFGGTGSTGNPYVIKDVYGLQGIAYYSLGTSYILGSDVDASGTANWNSGAGFVPIGTSSSAYTGTFNGAGYDINNLTITRSTSDYIGLFAYSTGSLRSVSLVNASIKGRDYTGGVVGYNGGTITNSTVTGSVSGRNNVGGLTGRNDDTISNSSATATVTGSSNSGGLVGYNNDTMVNVSFSGVVNGGTSAGGIAGLNNGTIRSATNSGTVSGTYAVGGIAGLNSTSGTITASVNQATISALASSQYVGGIVGQNYGTLSNVINNGTVLGTDVTNLGGIAGGNMSGFLSSSTNNGKIIASNSSNIGGIVGSNSTTLSGSVNKGNIVASNSTNAGGIAGQNSGTITNSSNTATGTVSAVGSNNVGGLVGSNINGRVLNSTNAATVSGSTYVGGVSDGMIRARSAAW